MFLLSVPLAVGSSVKTKTTLMRACIGVCASDASKDEICKDKAPGFNFGSE